MPIFSLCLLMLFLSACTKDRVESTSEYYSDAEKEILSAKLNLPLGTPHEYSTTPPSFMAGIPTRIQRGKATLGRVLFYDTELSLNKSVSCASCHHQANAFADPVAQSEGFNGELTPRNSFALGSTSSASQAYGGPVTANLFWDGRARTIAEQSTQTIEDAIEMGLDMDELVKRVREIDYYQVLFKRAYWLESTSGQPDQYITKERLLESIEAFMLSFFSHNSKFDKGYKDVSAANFDPFAKLDNFTESENLGKTLFMTQCATCHGTTSTTASIDHASNGLDIAYEDKGIGELDNHPLGMNGPEFDGVFKVPTLRNIELTGPYMHDGRFDSLEEVIEHYSTGIKEHRNLHRLLKENNGSPRQFNFSETEKKALVDFLKTLTDPVFITAERFADPFKE